jgi:hypothetical protein
MIRRGGLVLAILLSVATAPLRAGESQVGTSGANFLKIGAGARPTGMGHAVVGIVDDVNAAYYNPAGLSNISRLEISALHTQWFQDMDYDYAAVAVPTDSGALALSAATLRVSEIQRRESNEGLTGTFDSMDAAYGVSWARNMGPRLAIGLTGRYIQQRLAGVTGTGFSGDAGVMFHGLGKWTAGAALRHAGSDIKFRSEKDPLPRTFDVGAGRRFLSERLLIGTQVSFPRDNNPNFGFGSEFSQRLAPTIVGSLRLGYTTTTQDAGASGLTLGAGLAFKNWGFGFAWVPLGELGNTMRYELHMRI